MTEEKKNNSRKKESSPPEFSLVDKNTYKGNDKTERTQPTQNKKQHIFPKWHNLPDSDKIQLLVAIAALATLIVFSVSIVVQSCQTRESLAKTDTSNAYTRRSLELAEQNYIIENRAWVGLEDFPQIVPTNTVVIMDAKSGKQRPEEIEIKFGIKNFGKTPADSIYIRDSCIIASTRKDFIFPQIPVDTYKGRWAMSPNQVIYCVNPITKKQWSGVFDGNARLFICGIIIYKDIYRKTVDTTSFAYEIKSNTFIPIGTNNYMK